MHFGLHLMRKGLITAEQLVAALEAQIQSLTPIGQIALEEGLLTPRDLFDVMCAQSESPSVHFGELAIEMRLLTRDDLMRLLMIQADRRRPIVDILIQQRILTADRATQELTQYRIEISKERRKSATLKFVPLPRYNGSMKHPVENAHAVHVPAPGRALALDPS